MGTTKTLHIRRQRPAVPAGWRNSSHSDYMLKLLPHLALADFIKGKADQTDWNTLSFRLHLAQELAKRHAPMVLDDMNQAVACLLTVQERHALNGKWKMTKTEALLIGDGINYADQLQDLCTRMMQKLAGVHLIKTSMHKLAQIGVVSREKAMVWAA